LKKAKVKGQSDAKNILKNVYRFRNVKCIILL